MNLQIFGWKNCKNTKKAERFFKERRIPFQLIDLKKKDISAGELKSILGTVKLEELLDKETTAYKKGGYQYKDFNVLEEIQENPALLKTPIVRNAKKATSGLAEEIWQKWIKEDA